MTTEHKDVRARPVRSESAAAGRIILRTSWWIRSAVGMLTFCVGCPDEPALDPSDASVPEVRPPEPPTPPDIPWLEAGEPPIEPPRFTPCPPGWREVADPESGTETCDPWPEGGPEDCAAVDEAHFPGEAGCTRIGTPCSPDDDWAAELSSDADIFYVRAGAPPGGTGTRDSPFGTIAEAVLSAGRGDVIALSRGTFDVEEVRLGAGVTLWGACVAETVVTSSTPSESAGTVTVVGNGAVLRNLRVSGRRPGVWVVDGYRSAELHDVLVASSAFVGIRVSTGAIVTSTNLVVRDTQGGPTDGRYGYGLGIDYGGKMHATHAVLERNRNYGVWAQGSETELVLADVAIRETVSDSEGGGTGLGVDGAKAQVNRAAIDRNSGGGLLLMGDTAVVVLADLVVRGRLGEPLDPTLWARGLEVDDGATVHLARALFEGSLGTGVLVGSGATVRRMADIVVRDTAGLDSRGLGVQAGAHVTGDRLVFERNGDAGVVALGPDTMLLLTNIVIRDNEGDASDSATGEGLVAVDRAHVLLARTVLERNRDVALVARDDGTFLRASDLVVRHTSGRPDGLFGRGLHVGAQARVVVERALFEWNREVSVSAWAPGTQLSLDDVVVRHTLERECSVGWCREGGAGHAVGAYGGGQVRMSRFVVASSASCGFQLAFGMNDRGELFEDCGVADLREGQVVNNRICGVNVRSGSFDLNRIRDQVIFRDNGRDLETGELSAPEAGI